MKLHFGVGRLAWLSAALVLISACASASPIFGQFGVSGPGVLVFNNAGSNFLQFCTFANATGAGCLPPVTATGDFGVSGPGTNSFSVLTTADVGTVKNTSDHTGNPPFSFLPTGVSTTLNNYLTIASKPTWNFQANLLLPAACPGGNTASQVCIGPFQLNQNNVNVNVFMNVLGTLINTADNTTSTLNISFSATYNNTTIQQVIQQAQSATGAFNPSWAATISASAIPEPSTSSMLIGGGCLLALSQIRRRRRPATLL